MGADRIDSAVRVISAPAATIFEALTKRDVVAEWLPPNGSTAKIGRFEARPGGQFQMTLHFSDTNVPGKTTKNSDTVKGHFVRVEPDRLVDQAIEFESDDAAFAGTMRMLWSLDPESENSTVVRVEAHAVPPGIDPSDHAKGLSSSLENLARWCEADRSLRTS